MVCHILLYMWLGLDLNSSAQLTLLFILFPSITLNYVWNLPNLKKTITLYVLSMDKIIQVHSFSIQRLYP